MVTTSTTSMLLASAPSASCLPRSSAVRTADSSLIVPPLAGHNRSTSKASICAHPWRTMLLVLYSSCTHSRTQNYGEDSVPEFSPCFAFTGIFWALDLREGSSRFQYHLISGLGLLQQWKKKRAFRKRKRPISPRTQGTGGGALEYVCLTDWYLIVTCY